MKEVQYLNIVKNNKPEASVSQILTHDMEMVIQPEQHWQRAVTWDEDQNTAPRKDPQKYV
jgi:hypothetical protein